MCNCKMLLFDKRLTQSTENIRNKSTDKELNNLFFLTLFELPYIFCEGKILAGFLEKESNHSKNGTYLMDQPLNTLHLTERVNNGDHFEKIIESLHIINNDGGIKALDAKSGSYEIVEKTVNGKCLLDYLGLIPVTKEPSSWQYLENQKDEVKIYLFKFDINEKYSLFIIWSDGTSHEHTCREDRYDKLSSEFENLFKNEVFESDFEIQCLKVPQKEELKKTIDFDSIEQELISRDYLDKTLDYITTDIYKVLGIESKAAGFRCVFLRTKKPNVNYFVIQVTPEMLRVIYKEVKDIVQTGDHLFFQNTMIDPYNKYYEYFKENTSSMEFQYLCTEHDLRLTIKQLMEIQKHESESPFGDSTIDIKNILEYHEAICSGKNNFSWNINNEKSIKQHQILYYTTLTKTIIENTPLVKGVAYQVGKRGIPDFSLDWLEGNKIKHPFGTISYDDEDSYRYPKYFDEFIDLRILKAADQKSQIMLDIPVIYNGKLFGIFIVYPERNKDRKVEEFFSDYYPKIIKAVDQAGPELMRALFLDVCANVTTILSGEGKRKIIEKDDLLKNAEKIIRYTHGIPRTYIIDVTDKNNAENLKKQLEEKALGDLKNELNEIVNNEDDIFNFVKDGAKYKLLTINQLGQNMKDSPDMKDNPVVGAYYISHKIIKLAKWQFLVIQLFSKRPDKLSVRERNHALYLCQAIETGLRNLEKKHEIIKQGTRAAVAAIMGRNMSHNIGSHVLSYWKNDLDKSNKDISKVMNSNELDNISNVDIDKLKNQFDKIKVDKRESNNVIEKTQFLLDYLKNRMDFIAEITTTPPSWEKSINLYAIIQRFLEQKALLDNIILSEGFCYIGDSISTYKTCRKNSRNNCNGDNRCQYNSDSGMELVPYKIKLSGGKSSIEKYDVSIPHGHIGEQAIYSIFENLIRNSAKHGGKKIKERIGNKADSVKMFEININAEDAGEFIALIVSDNVGNCNDIIKDSNGKKRRIIKFVNEGLQDTGDSGFVSSSGELVKEKWGIKEIKMSANFLRKRTTDSLVDKDQIDDDDREKPLIHLACYESSCRKTHKCKVSDKNIAYTFYLRKPKEACIVYSNNELNQNIINKKDELQKKGILILTLDEAIDILQKKENIPHRFLVLSSKKTWNKLCKNANFNRQRLPLRIIVNATKQNGKAANNKALLKEVYSIVDFSKLTNSPDEFIKSIYESYCTKFKVHNIITQMPSNGEKNTSIYFDDHGKSYEKSKIDGIFYYHPYGTTIGKTFCDYFEPHKNNCEPIKSELIEMANVKVVISDERIYNINQNKKVSTQGKESIDNKLELLRDYMKISVVPVISGVVDKNNVLNDKNAGDFLIIHQGLIDKMTDKKKFYQEVKNKYSYIVIDSGRGVPNNLEEGTRYIEIGAIERFVEELDKNSLIQTLFSLRRPKHV